MRRFISWSIIFLWILAFGCSDDGSDLIYDPKIEMANYRSYVADQRGDIVDFVENREYRRALILFRDHVHWANVVRNDPLYLPYWSFYYLGLVSGANGNLCRGMSIHAMAFVQAFLPYEMRHIELWTGYETAGGIPVTHSVFEVLLDDHWEIYDTTFNCRFALISEPDTGLSAEEIREALEAGQAVMPIFDGFERKSGYDLSDEETLCRYWEYFNEIRPTFEQVFFDPNASIGDQ